MINLKEHFPALYKDILENIDFENEQKLGNKEFLIVMHGEKDRPRVLEYTHDYRKVSKDVFSTLEVWAYMEDHNDEVDAFLDKHPELDFDGLCDLLEENLKNDVKIQSIIYDVMVDFNFYEMDEELEDVIINHLPERLNVCHDNNNER